MSNLSYYDKMRTVPETAKKSISGGRLNGKTDINPMWRIKTLTEQFGMCGMGWKYAIVDERLEKGANDEIAAFVDIDLFVKVDGKWSDAIPGTGGSMFVAKEKSGLYTSDECYKMALTDALSVACKALGVGADVYFAADASKYDRPAITGDKPAIETISKAQIMELTKECMTIDGKPDMKQIERLKAIYNRYGYHDAKDIQSKDFDKIKREFIESALPFDLEGEQE
jgi:hypothetical protein